MITQLFLILSCLTPLVSPSTYRSSTLVLSDNSSAETLDRTHQDFLQSLAERGHAITHHLVDTVLDLYDSNTHQLVYDNLVLFAPEAEDLLGHLDTDPITQFIQHGGNVFFAASSKSTSFLIHELAVKCGIQLGDTTADDDTMMADDGTAGDTNPTTYSNVQSTTDETTGTTVVTQSDWPGMDQEWKVLYNGVTMSKVASSRKATIAAHRNANSRSKSYYTPLLHISSTTGGISEVVVGVEARNGARVVVSGSWDMCSNALYHHKHTNDNPHFCNYISAWAFQEKGQLRATVQLTPTETNTNTGAEQNNKALWSAGVASHLSTTYSANDTLAIHVAMEEVDRHDQNQMQWHAHDVPTGNKIHVHVLSLGKVISHVVLEAQQDATHAGRLQLPATYGAYVVQVLYENQGYSAFESRRTIYIAPPLSESSLTVWMTCVVGGVAMVASFAMSKQEQ